MGRLVALLGAAARAAGSVVMVCWGARGEERTMLLWGFGFLALFGIAARSALRRNWFPVQVIA
ncbi:hypothetical protein caldi_32370 [Caldinitratiruptor microaerophilus]|uniref:Uncharacterized protein n=1 Tax=Caldinitratiruptor microaerophilus TaxID=671077 RepID=A0AA35CMY1_9FIRM|nr:hypothetical protein caldi_32370 [Caldinitratiruptor microaerophilus]